VKLRDYQKEGVKFLLNNKRALLGDDMGLGKTIQTVDALRRLGSNKTLIICPSAVAYSWASTLKKWGNKRWSVHIVSAEVETIPDVSVVICSYHLLNSPMIYDQLNVRWSVVVADEVHWFKNPDAKRSQKMLKPKGIASKSIYFWGLSGTIQPSNPLDLYLLLSTLFRQSLGKYYKYESYIRRFCGAYRTTLGWRFGKAKNVEELGERIRPFFLRRLKEEVLTELPPKSLTVRWLKESGELAKNDTWQEMMAKVDTEKVTLGLTIDEMTEERKLSALDKVGAVGEYIETIDDKVVVFCWHREIVETLHNKYSNSVKYYGGMTPKAKEEAKQKFIKDPECKYFFANISSAGTGLDGLQFAAYRCVFVEIPWGFAELYQAIDRLHRMGQGMPVMADVFALEAPIDRYMIQCISNKHKTFLELTA